MTRRGVSLPEGKPSDGPEQDMVHGLSARKNRAFLAQIRRSGVDVYPSMAALIHHLRGFGIKVALVTASRNCAEIFHVDTTCHTATTRIASRFTRSAIACDGSRSLACTRCKECLHG